MTTDIQPVTAKTRDAALALMIRFFREEGFATAPKQIAQNLDWMLADPSCWCALAFVRGAPAGVVTVSTTLYIEWGRLGEIGDLYVVPEQRRRGLARELIARAKAWCTACGCTAASVTVTPIGERRHRLSEFYRGQGFEPTERATFAVMLKSP